MLPRELNEATTTMFFFNNDDSKKIKIGRLTIEKHGKNFGPSDQRTFLNSGKKNFKSCYSQRF